MARQDGKFDKPDFCGGLMMIAQEKSACPRQENAPFKTLRPKHTKEAMILTIMREGQSLNRFEAERLGDHCLHSTISTLRNKGYLFRDEWEWVRTRFGETHVKRYRYIGFAC